MQPEKKQAAGSSESTPPTAHSTANAAEECKETRTSPSCSCGHGLVQITERCEARPLPSNPDSKLHPSTEEQQALNQQLELIPACCHVLNSSGTMLAVNSLWLEALGHAREQILGSSILDFIVDVNKSSIVEVLAASPLNQPQEATFCQLMAADGSTRSFSLASRVSYEQYDMPLIFGVLTPVSVEDNLVATVRKSHSRYQNFIEHCPYGVFVVTSSGQFVEANPAGLDLIGCKTENELRGLDFNTLVFPEREDLLQNSLAFLKDNGHLSLETTFRKLDGRLITARIDAVSLNDDISIGFCQDITRRARAEQAIQESEARFRSIVDGSPIGIYLCEDVDGLIVLRSANQAAERILGIDHTDMLNRPLRASFPPDIFPELSSAMLAAMYEGRNWSKTEVFVETESFSGVFDIHAFRCSESTMAIMFSNAGERALARKVIENAAERHRAMFYENTLPQLLIYPPNGAIVEANQAAQTFYGLTEEDFQGISIIDLETSDSRTMESQYRAILSKGSERFQSRHRLKNGFIRDVDVTVCTLEQESRTFFFATIVDITEQLQAENTLRISEARFRRFFQDAKLATFQALPSGEFTLVNHYAATLFGLVSPESITPGETSLATFLQDPSTWEHVLDMVRENGSVQTTSECVRTDGTTFMGRMSLWLVRDSWGRPVSIEGTVEDITERKRMEEEIQASLAEKDTLLKEIHHRVKNNLQIITSLLSLQTAHSEHAELHDAFRECCNRISSMALVHEELYRSTDIRAIDFESYVRSLSGKLLSIFRKSRNVTVKLDIRNMFFPIDIAIPCGLVINELMTNSMKHAFSANTKDNTILIHSRLEGDHVVVVYEDNGTGLPDKTGMLEAHAINTNTLGMKLMGALASQLKGSYKVISNPQDGDLPGATGLRFEITFPFAAYPMR